MTKTITLETTPPVDVKLWETRSKHFWRYNYDDCNKNGPFSSYHAALKDAIQYSNNPNPNLEVG